MKTKKEIEQLAEQDFNDRQECGLYELADLKSRDYYYDGFTNGYNQCQEDMADKKYTELQLRFFADELIKGIEEKNKQGYEDIKVDYESLILLLCQEDARQELENRMNINRILKGY